MSIFSKKQIIAGFTLVELMVVISIIGILSSIVYANFGSAKAISRDNLRKTNLKDLQLALELYKAQNNGQYPVAGCSAGTGWAGTGGTGTVYGTNCALGVEYIVGLVPDYIPALPTDPNFENDRDKGFYYRTNAARNEYKIMVRNSVEKKTVSSGDEYALCSAGFPSCTSGAGANSYAIYKGSSAASW